MLPDALFLNVHMYGIMVALGVMAAFSSILLYQKKLGFSSALADFLFYDGIAAIFVGFGSAALFQSLYNFIEHPEHGFHLGEGITFLGGLIGGAACFLAGYFIFRRKLPFSLPEVLEIAPCCITVAHGFGRVGCFFAGCCYGKPTDSFLGVKFPQLAERVHPTQLYEAAFLFILFGVLSWLLLKRKGSYNFSIYLIGYGIFRYLLEFLRDDSRGKLIGVLSPSQFWSVVMVVIGIALVVYTIKKSKAPESEEIIE